MNTQRANEIEVLLEGVRLPASRDQLVRYAMGEDRDAAASLRRLPDRQFDRLDEVGALLVERVRPPQPPASLPIPESGRPPGGDDYARPFPRPGAVRELEPQKDVLQQQTKTQKKQKAKQETS